MEKVIHIGKLSGGAFCGDRRVDILNTTLYSERDKCTCKNCLKVAERLNRLSKQP